MSRLIDLQQFWRDRPDLKAKRKEFAVLAVVWLNLGVTAVDVPAQCITGDDYDFVITTILGTQAQANNQVLIGAPLLMRMQNQSLSRNIDNLTLEWNANGVRINTRLDDCPMPYPIVLPSNSQFVITMTNPGGNGALNVWIALHGIKCFHDVQGARCIP